MTSDGEFPDSDLDVEGEDAPWVDDLPDDDVDSAQDVLVAAARAAAIAEFACESWVAESPPAFTNSTSTFGSSASSASSKSGPSCSM